MAKSWLLHFLTTDSAFAENIAFYATVRTSCDVLGLVCFLCKLWCFVWEIAYSDDTYSIDADMLSSVSVVGVY